MIKLVQALDRAGARYTELPLDDGLEVITSAVDAVLDDPDLDGLDDGDRAIVRFVPRLALAPRTMHSGVLHDLTEAGLDDTTVHDVVQVCCCFSYMNRLADGLGVGQTEPNRAWATKLYGEARWEAHLKWKQPAQDG